ncbi:hypothetical protein L2750_06055 [Shewanella submarina]|uniref:Uncharacterized protein n=1 Tax=Shewanella submarina TaxID=2016376 RepID=A0ABV7GDL7_9GAMM|nr:hypothetical protein [Shewanella submarina]MCL1036713.1 hypothetical protein [Shewanella submarina]
MINYEKARARKQKAEEIIKQAKLNCKNHGVAFTYVNEETDDLLLHSVGYQNDEPFLNVLIRVHSEEEGLEVKARWLKIHNFQANELTVRYRDEMDWEDIRGNYVEEVFELFPQWEVVSTREGQRPSWEPELNFEDMVGYDL